MEKWDLYNAKREKSGITVCRGEIIPKGLYHLSVSAWIVNQQGQYLLSQRHPKKQYPLYWECTGGSVLSGETSLQGAIREVKEELGILLTPGSEKLIYQTRRENVQDFYDVWLFHRDIKIEEMRLQETEVVDVQWVSSDTVLQGNPQGDFPVASSARPPVNGNALDPPGDPFLGVILPQGLAAGEAFLSGSAE